MNDVTIRRATRGDRPRINEILYLDPTRDVIAGVGSVERARRLGPVMEASGLDVDVRRTLVAVAGGVVAGIMETMRPYEDSNLSLGTMLLVLKRAIPVFGPGVLVSYVRFARARSRVEIKRAPESLYVAELDVHPDLRGRGIGGELLSHADRVAATECFKRLSLTTGIDNPARRLYERSGYRVAEERRDPAYERVTGSPGRVLMVKDL